MIRKSVSLLLVLVLCLSLAGTAFAADLSLSDFPWADSVAGKTEGLVDMDENLTIRWFGFNKNGILPKDDTLMEQVVEKRFNITVENILVDVYNKEQANLLLNTGVVFDINSYANYNFSDLVEKELVREVDPELLYKYCPDIVAYLEKDIGKDWINLSTVNGKCYGIPTNNTGNAVADVMVLRTDWLKNIGYDETNLPTTIEGLEEMLAKLHTEDPDGNGKEDTYALNTFQNYGQYEFGYYGLSNNYWFYEPDGSLSYWVINERSKDALKLMQRWFKLGIYDPETITDDRFKVIAKFTEGTVAGYTSFDNSWSSNATNTVSALVAARELGQDVDLTIIPLPEGGKTAQHAASYSSKGVMFGYDCSDEKLVRLLQMMNCYFGDMDLYLLDNLGEKGLHWDYDESGNIIKGARNGLTDALDAADTGRNRYYDYQLVPSDILVKVKLTDPEMKYSRYQNYMAAKDYEMVPMAIEHVFTTDADVEFGTSANKVSSEYFLKAITGEVDIDETYDDFVERWLAAGGQEILDAKKELFGN